MQSEQIEERAISAIKDEAAKYDILKACLAEGDKRISWDGYITVFKQDWNKKDWLYDINIQVKGRKVNKLGNGNSKFSVEISDLLNYQKEGKGTLFLVVDIVDYKTRQIYYANLLPVDLNYILNTVKDDQKTKTIDIRPICESSQSSLKNICLNFVNNSKKQMGTPIMDFEELKDNELKNIDRIVSQVTVDNGKIFDYMLNNDVYQYAYLGDSSKIALPKSSLVMISNIITGDIKIGSKIYYKEYEFAKTKDGEHLKIGQGIIFNLATNIINFQFNGKLSDRIIDIEFFLALIKDRKLTIRGADLTFPDYKKDLSETQSIIKNWTYTLNKFKLIKNTFNKFNIDFNEDIDKLTDKDIKNLTLFVDIFGSNNLSKNITITKTGLYNIKIAKFRILIWAVILEDGTIKCYNFFEDLSKVVHIVLTRDGSKPTQDDYTTPYLLLTKENLLDCSNFNVNTIKKSFELVANYEIQEHDINMFMLHILELYDKDNSRLDLLDLASFICDKLLSYNKSTTNIINSLQITKRKRKLYKEEIEKLYNLKDNLKKDTDYNMFQCGIAIILENKSDYEYFFGKLDKNVQANFVEFPIYNLIQF